MEQPIFRTAHGQLQWELHGSSYPNRLATTKQMASMLYLSPKTLETMRSRGGGPAYLKIRGRVFYDIVEGIHWFEQNLEAHK